MRKEINQRLDNQTGIKIDWAYAISGIIAFAGVTILTFALLAVFMVSLSKGVANLFAGITTLYPPIIAGVALFVLGIVLACFTALRRKFRN